MTARFPRRAGLAGASISVALALPAHAGRAFAIGDESILSGNAVHANASAAAHSANFVGVLGACDFAPATGCAAMFATAGLARVRRGRV